MSDCAAAISPFLVRSGSGEPLVRETTLLGRIAAGDRGAMVLAVDRYAGLVWSIAAAMGLRTEEAEEAVQEVMLALWENAGRFDPRLGAESSFVAMIARRRLIDRRRRTTRRDRLLRRFAGANRRPEQMSAGDPGPLAEELERLEEAMGQLSPDQRRVLHLAVGRSLTHEQVASSTGLPLGTVKTHVRRGLIRLRSLLQAESGTPQGRSEREGGGR